MDLLELHSLSAEAFYLMRSHFTGSIAGQALLACLKELFGPTVIEVLVDPFPPAQFGDTVLAAQTGKDDPDLFLG